MVQKVYAQNLCHRGLFSQNPNMLFFKVLTKKCYKPCTIEYSPKMLLFVRIKSILTNGKAKLLLVRKLGAKIMLS